MAETMKLAKELPCVAVEMPDGRWSLCAADFSWGTPVYDERLLAFLRAREVPALSVLPPASEGK